ncbi:hypothetical protein FKM82_002359 [Ascaphus truei]
MVFRDCIHGYLRFQRIRCIHCNHGYVLGSEYRVYMTHAWLHDGFGLYGVYAACVAMGRCVEHRVCVYTAFGGHVLYWSSVTCYIQDDVGYTVRYTAGRGITRVGVNLTSCSEQALVGYG